MSAMANAKRKPNLFMMLFLVESVYFEESCYKIMNNYSTLSIGNLYICPITDTNLIIMRSINEINIDIPEGKLLLASMAKITTESQTDKTPNQVLRQLNKLSKKMFKS